MGVALDPIPVGRLIRVSQWKVDSRAPRLLHRCLELSLDGDDVPGGDVNSGEVNSGDVNSGDVNSDGIHGDGIAGVRGGPLRGLWRSAAVSGPADLVEVELPPRRRGLSAKHGMPTAVGGRHVVFPRLGIGIKLLRRIELDRVELFRRLEFGEFTGGGNTGGCGVDGVFIAA